MMKKLFTSLLLLSVALCSWGAISVKSFTGGVLTLESSAGDSFTSFYESLTDAQTSAWYGKVTKLVLDGAGFTNSDFNGGKMGEFIANCAGSGKTLYLDLSDASGLVSKVTYTTTDKNPVKDPKYLPDGSTTYEYYDADFETKYYIWDSNGQQKYVTPGTDYNDPNSYPYIYEEGGTWKVKYGENNIQNLNSEKVWYYIYNGSHITIDNSNYGNLDQNNKKYKLTVVNKPFSFGGNIDQNNTVQQEGFGKYINGISFPNGSNFTAIPDNLCCYPLCPNLESVVWGDQLEWIGKNAFKGAVKKSGQAGPYSKLAYFNGTTDANVKGKVSFPSTLKVICLDAFYGCKEFKEVDLDLPNLVKVDAAAFNMVNDNDNELTTVYLPGQKSKTSNETLKFWGNQVFSGSKVNELNFRYCEGITNFAYDTKNSMEEGTWENPDQSGASATNTFYWHQYMTKLVLPPNLSYISGGEVSKTITRECVRLETIEFTGRAQYDDNCNLTNGLVIPKFAFAFAQTDETVNVNKVTNEGIGSSTLRKLKNVILSDNITNITEFAFWKTSLETIHIPASVQTIEAKAFESCRALKVVVFDDVASDCQECKDKIPVTTVKSPGDGEGAFNNCAGVTDVYVNRPENLVCENYGFDAATTYGRGNAAAGFATLHFPEKYMENYVNTKHELTNEIILNPGLFHSWLMIHMKQATMDPPKNGWWEFINAGPMKTNIDEEPTYQSIMLRTFSDAKNSYLVPDGLRAYIVNKVEKNTKTGNYELSLQRLAVIPAKTGVILYGHPNGRNLKGEPILSMTPVFFAESGDKVQVGQNQYVTAGPREGKPLCRANWGLLGPNDQEYKNYLEPTSTENGGIDLKPYERFNDDPTKPVMYRNFIMSRYKTTLYKDADKTADDANYMGFFRVVRGSYPAGYAYLKLAGDVYENGDEFPVTIDGVTYNSEYSSATGSEIIVKEDLGPAGNGVDGYYYETDISNGQLYNARAAENMGKKLNPRRWWDDSADLVYPFTWKEPTMSWGSRKKKFNDDEVLTINWELEEDTDGIVKLIVPAEDNTAGDYYTLQGVKVINPTKGVYIRNGKKVVVK